MADYIIYVTFSLKGTHIISGVSSEPIAVRIWDPHRTSLGVPLTSHTCPLHSITFSPDKMRVVSVGETIRLSGIGKLFADPTGLIYAVAIR